VAYWLLKTEPGEFSWDDLVRLGRDRWNGVRNWAAIRSLAAMRPGDLAVFYHTGGERQAVGICRVVTAPYPDPEAGDPRIVVVDVEPLARLERPVPLAALRADPAFAGWELLRQPRLSVLPVPEAMWARLQAMGAARP